tara:strand:- start:958 stop:1497 length:540 start_codon:yes stop_codon:yes gene_type:complete
MRTFFKLAYISAGTLIASTTMTGCASHNYDFAAAANSPARIAQLVDELDRVNADEEATEKELYEINLFPLVHSHLHVFAEGDEDDSPAEFIEAEIDSYLPLFGFVDGTVNQYDGDQQLITQHNFDSSLWGAFGKRRELITTPSGIRETTRHTFLWLFKWWGKEQWHTTDGVAHGDEAKP